MLAKYMKIELGFTPNNVMNLWKTYSVFTGWMITKMMNTKLIKKKWKVLNKKHWNLHIHRISAMQLRPPCHLFVLIDIQREEVNFALNLVKTKNINGLGIYEIIMVKKEMCFSKEIGWADVEKLVTK